MKSLIKNRALNKGQAIINLKIVFMLFLVLSQSMGCSQPDKKVDDVKGLQVGDRAQMFTALDADSNMFFMEEALTTSPVLLIFYRGFWCPVCNKHLAGIQDSLTLIQEKGVRVIAVSPEKPDYLSKMKENTGATFTLLYDDEYKISNAFDVNYDPSKFRLLTYNAFMGAKIKESHSDDSQRLPIPATFIINQEGLVIWRQFDPDYHKRSTVKDILNAIDQNYHSSSKVK